MNVGDIVSWESQSGGFKTKKVGTIMAVVPAKSSASLFIPEGFACNSKLGYGLSRDHESYLVKVKGKGRKLYWPLVKHLHSQKDTV
jgi:hypothetical protein